MSDQQQPGCSQHFTRSQTRLHYKAAGVLPFAFQHGIPVVLLGAEAVKTGPQGKITKTMWRDFGGQREAIDIDSESTASREFAEETMGLFGGCDVNGSCVAACTSQMHAQLSRGQNVLKVVHQLKKGEYHMYITQTPHIDPLMFHLALQQNNETDAVCGAEKTAFAWVALSDLMQAIVPCAKRYFLNAYAHTTGNRRQSVFHGLRRMQLHPCFASSLRLAQEAGLMAFIATARAATLVQHTLPDSMPDGLLPTRTCAHQPAQLDQVRGIHALHCVGAEPLGHAVMTAALCSEPAEQQFISQEEVRLGAAPSSLQMPGLRAAKRVPADVMTGLTPEHMLYWVSQADVAQQLRCTEAQGDDVIAASHQALANPLGAAPAEEGSHPLQDSAAAARSDATVAEIVARQPEEQKVARKTVRQKHARPGSVKKASRKQLSC